MVRLTPSPHLSPLGHTLTLSCSYDAIPTPSVTWMRDAVVLSDDSRTSVTLDPDSRSSELTLDELEREEGGAYVCMFTNEVGGGVASIAVTVQGTSYHTSTVSHCVMGTGSIILKHCHQKRYCMFTTLYSPQSPLAPPPSCK